MIEPASLANFFTIFFTSAMVIMCGALYALLFAYSRIRKSSKLMPLAYASYAGLFASVLFLADAANLFNHPVWQAVVVFMLVGYLLAPHAIWHLCVGTHANAHEIPAASENSST
ncbi:MAG: hypothetical protein IPM27_02545 [Nitrosomonadales bacterium]|nr:hypothetical protein [Nitrosomonadales bacterium]